MTMHLFLILFCKQDSYELNDINLWTNLKSLGLQMMKKKNPKKKNKTLHTVKTKCSDWRIMFALSLKQVTTYLHCYH